MLIANWKEVLRKSLVVWAGIAGAILPEIPDLVLKFVDSDASAQVMSPETKNYVRMAIMFFVIPLARVVSQSRAPKPLRLTRPDDAAPTPAAGLKE